MLVKTSLLIWKRKFRTNGGQGGLKMNYLDKWLQVATKQCNFEYLVIYWVCKISVIHSFIDILWKSKSDPAVNECISLKGYLHLMLSMMYVAHWWVFFLSFFFFWWGRSWGLFLVIVCLLFFWRTERLLSDFAISLTCNVYSTTNSTQTSLPKIMLVTKDMSCRLCVMALNINYNANKSLVIRYKG